MNNFENNFEAITEIEALEAQLKEIAEKINAAKIAKANKIRKAKDAILATEEFAFLIANGVAINFSDEESSKDRQKAVSRIAPKYRNPKDFSETWTGRGIAPEWVSEYAETVSNAFKAARKSGNPEKIKAAWQAEKDNILKRILIPAA